MSDSVFMRIVRGEIGSYKVWEDDDIVAILDIEPVNKGHVLILTKQPYVDVRGVPDDLLAKILPLARDLGVAVCEEFGYPGFNIHQSNGAAAGQDIFHYHMHVWPRRSEDEITFMYKEEVSYADGEIGVVAERIRRSLERVERAKFEMSD